MVNKTPMEQVIDALHKFNAEDFHKYIYDYGDILVELEKDLINGK